MQRFTVYGEAYILTFELSFVIFEPQVHAFTKLL